MNIYIYIIFISDASMKKKQWYKNMLYVTEQIEAWPFMAASVCVCGGRDAG